MKGMDAVCWMRVECLSHCLQLQHSASVAFTALQVLTGFA